MAKEGGFFSPNRKVSGKDKQVASSMSAGSYGGFVDAGERRGFVSPEQAESMLANPERFKMRPSETRYLRESMGLPRAQFFSPSGNEIGQIASATTDLSGLMASKLPSDYKETESQVNFENMLRKNFDDPDSMDYGIKQFIKQDFQRPDGTYDSPVRFQDNLINKALTDTKIAAATFDKESFDSSLQNDFGFDSDSRLYKNLPSYMKQDLKEQHMEKIKNLKFQDSSFAPTESPKESPLQKAAGFLANVFTGTQPVAAGTLDANQQVAQVSERPKLSYVNPDAKTMSLSEIAEAFKPKNLFGYKDKFGRFDDPGSPLARDRAETMQRVAQNFSSPITADARTIGQIRADQEARMRENARLRNESFQRGERVKQKSADVTYGTNMLSNPAFGFRDKMTDAAKAQYDKSAKDATEMARTDPSLGNVAMQTFNRISGFFGGPQGSLESVGERQLRLANKEINRPTYQKEAYARKMLGITNDQLKARNLQRIRANAAARNQAFQSDRRAKAVERVARRYGQNTGSGRTGGFGSGTVGKGMSSNPASQRQQGVGVSANNLSRHSVGHSSTQPGAKGGSKKGGVSGKTGRPKGNKGGQGGQGGQGGGPKSSGQNKSLGKKNRVGRKVRCDIRTKIDITSLTNQNLIKDDLATVAYFVQELRGK